MFGGLWHWHQGGDLLNIDANFVNYIQLIWGDDEMGLAQYCWNGCITIAQ